MKIIRGIHICALSIILIGILVSSSTHAAGALAKAKTGSKVNQTANMSFANSGSNALMSTVSQGIFVDVGGRNVAVAGTGAGSVEGGGFDVVVRDPGGGGGQECNPQTKPAPVPCIQFVCLLGQWKPDTVSLNGDACNDSNACTVTDVCSGGACTGSGTIPNLNDNNVCTTDTCVNGAAVHTNNTAACNNGKACAGTVVCSGGACTGSGTIPNLNDNNPCTNDSCSNGVAVHTNNTAACNDGNACTVTDVCSGGACTGSGTIPNLNDNNPCTNDSCSNGVAVHTNNTAACNDGNACTVTDTCQNGACTGSGTDICYSTGVAIVTG